MLVIVLVIDRFIFDQMSDYEHEHEDEEHTASRHPASEYHRRRI